MIVTSARPRLAENKIWKNNYVKFSEKIAYQLKQMPTWKLLISWISHLIWTGVHFHLTKSLIMSLTLYKKSNHPQTILKNIPASINRRLSSISLSKEFFDSAVPPYQEDLDKAGYDFKLEFNENVGNQARNSRRNRTSSTLSPPPSLIWLLRQNLGKNSLNSWFLFPCRKPPPWKAK